MYFGKAIRVTLKAIFHYVIVLRNIFQAYYQRGLVRMKLKQSKGIQDFNRALALNPKLFQVRLHCFKKSKLYHIS